MLRLFLIGRRVTPHEPADALSYTQERREARTTKRPLSVHAPRGAIYPAWPAQKLSPSINVKLVVREEVFGRYADRMVSQPPLAGL
jgi:hypothetical protein